MERLHNEAAFRRDLPGGASYRPSPDPGLTKLLTFLRLARFTTSSAGRVTCNAGSRAGVKNSGESALAGVYHSKNTVAAPQQNQRTVLYLINCQNYPKFGCGGGLAWCDTRCDTASPPRLTRFLRFLIFFGSQYR